MKRVATIIPIAAAHIAFLFWAYGSKFFGLHLPYHLALFLWLVASTILAGFGHFKATSKLTTTPYIRGVIAVVLSLASLYVGVFLALNTYGE